jgi:hypothetical protein
MYLMCLEAFAPERQLYLALSEAVWEKLSELKIAQDFLDRFSLRLLIVNLPNEEIVLWKKMSEYRQIVRRIFEHYAQPRPSYPATGVEKFLIWMKSADIISC